MARLASTAEPKARAARQMRATATLLDNDHPEMMAGDHLRDAARLTEHGSAEGAKRHLDAAMFMLTPQSLMRHGILDDDGHADAKHHMHQINRHRLAVEDIEDISARNQRLASVARAARGQPEPAEPFHHPPPQPGLPIAAARSPGGALDLAFYDIEPRSKDGKWTSGAGVFGSHISRKEAAGFAAMFGPPGGRHQRPGGSRDAKAAKKAAQAVEVSRLNGSQRKVYGKLRARGRPHKFALQAAQMPMNDLAKSLSKAMAGLAGDGPALQLAFRSLELSARTAMLERTPAPRGKPGGPGLYHVEGMGHTNYLQQIVKALIEKRGMKPSKAYAIARASLRKWAARSKHPEVRGAATAAEAGEIARQARAHAHTAADWEVADVLVELAAGPVAIELFNPNHAPTGRFTTASGAGQGGGGQHGHRAQRQALVRKIAGLRQQIAALQAQLPQHHRSRTATPAKRGAAATSARQARQGKATAAKAGSKAPARMSPATIHAKIAALRATLAADVAQLRSLR